MSRLTVLILVPNAGDRLRACLESVKWADDVFCVVDPATTDGSLELARDYTDHVIVHEYVNAASQRNWALPQVQTEWTLVLDADERVSDGLREKIQRIVAAEDSLDYYEVRRLSYWFGKLIRHCGWDRDYVVRLFRTSRGRYTHQRVHARVDTDGPVGVIEEPMYHDTYRSFEEYFSTFHRFTAWGAEDLFEAGRRARPFDLVLRPWLRFLKMYVAQRGFLDGRHGAVLCALAAFSVFVKYARLWNLERLQNETGRVELSDREG